MRSEDTLRAAFALLDEHAPSELTRTLDTEPTRRRNQPGRPTRWLAPAAAALAVVSVAVALTLVVHARQPHHAAAPVGPSPSRPAIVTRTVTPPPPPSTATFVIWLGHAPDGWANYGLVECGTTRPYGTPVPAPKDSPDCGSAFRYRPGEFNLAKVQHGTPVTVDGHTGYQLQIAYLGDPINEPEPIQTTAWEYRPGYWAVVQTGGPTASTEAANVALARANAAQIESTSNEPTPANRTPSTPVPVVFTYRPNVLTGLRTQPVGESMPDTTLRRSCVPREPKSASISPCGASLPTPPSGSLYVVDYYSTDGKTKLTTTLYGPGARGGTPPNPSAASTTVTADGHTLHVGATTIDVTTGSYEIHVDYTGPGASPSDTLRIAKAMNFPQNINDLTTWFDGSNMIP
jgi:hypothetical protein